MPDNENIKIMAAQKANYIATITLKELQKNNKLIDPIEFEKYIIDLYEENLKEML